MPPSPPHKGLLREDLLALRRIFDLDLGRDTLEQGRSTILSLGKNLPDSATKDIFIVALDIEGVGMGQLPEDGQKAALLTSKNRSGFCYMRIWV
jgi:hypothetical protein